MTTFQTTPFILEFCEGQQALHHNHWLKSKDFWANNPFSYGYFPIFICHNEQSKQIADDFLEYIDFYNLRAKQKVTLEFILVSKEKFLQDITDNMNDFVKRYNLNDYVELYKSKTPTT